MTNVHVHAGALYGALQDLAARPSNSGRRPRGARFHRTEVGLVCVVMTDTGVTGYGCARPLHNDAGTFVPAPSWAARVERSLRAALGLPDTDAAGALDESTGMPLTT